MDTTSAAAKAGRLLVPVAAGLAAGLLAAGCSGNSPSASATGTQSTAPASQAATSAAPAAAGTESPPPGDIPDSTVYIPYHAVSGKYTVKVPQGWAQTATAGAVSFTDKLNTITVTTVGGTAPTVASARATEIPRIKGAVRQFALAGVSAVTRPAGSVVLIRYSAQSQPDPVTGKVYTDAVERYEFYRNGTEAVVTLSGPVGADNVDPWRTVTNSFRWLG
jgi:hypothetical protein